MFGTDEWAGEVFVLIFLRQEGDIRKTKRQKGRRGGRAGRLARAFAEEKFAVHPVADFRARTAARFDREQEGVDAFRDASAFEGRQRLARMVGVWIII